MRIAKERKSSVLASNAVHHRIDSLTSIVALVAIIGSHVLHNVSWLDPVGGLIVSMMVIRAGWGNTGNALLELSDVGVAIDVRESIHKTVMRALSDNSFACGKVTGSEVQVLEIQGVKAGQNYLMNIELAVPGDWSVSETCVVENAIRERVGATVRGVRRVRVRFVTKEIPDFADEFISADIRPKDTPEEGNRSKQVHGHTHDRAEGKTSNGDARRRH